KRAMARDSSQSAEAHPAEQALFHLSSAELFAGQSSSAPSSSQGAADVHHSTHHVQVPDEDTPSQPAELTEAEAAIDKHAYIAAEALLRKLVLRDPTSYVAWFDL